MRRGSLRVCLAVLFTLPALATALWLVMPTEPAEAEEVAAEAVEFAVPAEAADDDGGAVVVRYFYGDGCPFCAHQAVELDVWETELNVEIYRYEVWNDDANRALYTELAAAYGVEPRAVPATFIGSSVWLGFNQDLAGEMRAVIASCDAEGCDDPLATIGPPIEPPVEPDETDGPDVADDLPAAAEDADDGSGEATTSATEIRIPWVGTVDLTNSGVLASTALIAFVDGFNPCSLWVLSVLLALLIRGGSRLRLALVGAAFLGVTALIYGTFIAGVFGTMSYVGHLGWIRGVVAAFALTFAVVNIKDYVRLKQGPSFTIPDRVKPRIYRGGRRLALADDPLPVVLGATVVMAAGVALVELPCTAGFPVVWSGIMTDAGVAGASFVGLLGLYIGIYLLDEVVVLAVVVATMQISKVQEHHVQVLKLIGGTVMLALGVVMIFSPELLHSFAGTLAVFGAALVVAAVIHTARRLATR